MKYGIQTDYLQAGMVVRTAWLSDVKWPEWGSVDLPEIGPVWTNTSEPSEALWLEDKFDARELRDWLKMVALKFNNADTRKGVTRRMLVVAESVAQSEAARRCFSGYFGTANQVLAERS